jgi:6,7-dimethyl-8-ribityllumazine synthase
MPQELSGALDASGRRFGIVVARFNEFFTRRLMEGAVDALLRHGADEDDLTIVWVPGTWEVPMAVRRMALSGQFDAVLGLGLVLRGETNHHEHVAGEAAAGIAEAQRESGLPCPLGIVTAESVEQAVDRCGGKQGNRGWDAAMAALEMVNLMPALGPGGVLGSDVDVAEAHAANNPLYDSESPTPPTPRGGTPRRRTTRRGAARAGRNGR